MVENHKLHVPLTLDVSSQMEEKCIIMTGTLVQSYFLLPNLWVCKPYSILQHAAYEATTIVTISYPTFYHI